MRRYNSTISVKKKVCRSCGQPCYHFSKGRCQPCATREDTLAREESENAVIIEEEDLSGLLEDADAIFSQYIRLKYANERGLVKCYTCGIEKHWTMVDNGHLIKRAHLRFRLDERNCKPQCKTCNGNQNTNGEVVKFRERMGKEEPGVIEHLYDEMRYVYKPTRDEVRQVIAEYSPKVKELKKRLLENQK